jgi:hypothetical protein
LILNDTAPRSAAMLGEHFGEGPIQELIGLSHRSALPPALKLFSPMASEPLPALLFSTGVNHPVCRVVDEEERLAPVKGWKTISNAQFQHS